MSLANQRRPERIELSIGKWRETLTKQRTINNTPKNIL
jgi:hypothetical protein